MKVVNELDQISQHSLRGRLSKSSSFANRKGRMPKEDSIGDINTELAVEEEELAADSAVTKNTGSHSALTIAKDAILLGCTRLTAPPSGDEAVTSDERRQRLIAMKMQHKEYQDDIKKSSSTGVLAEYQDEIRRSSSSGVLAVGVLRGLFRGTSKRSMLMGDSYSNIDKGSNYSMLGSPRLKNPSSDSEEEFSVQEDRPPRNRVLSDRLSKQLRADLLKDESQGQGDNEPEEPKLSGTCLTRKSADVGAKLRRNLSSQRSREQGGSRHKSALNLSAHRTNDLGQDEDSPELPRTRSSENVQRKQTRTDRSRDSGATSRSNDRPLTRQRSAKDVSSHRKRGMKDELGAEVKSSDRDRGLPIRSQSGSVKLPTRPLDRVRRVQSDKPEERHSNDASVDIKTMLPTNRLSKPNLAVSDLLDTDDLGKDESDDEPEEEAASRRCPSHTRSGPSGMPRSRRDMLRGVRRHASERVLMNGDTAKEQSSTQRQLSGRVKMSRQSSARALKSEDNLEVSRGVQRQSSSRAMKIPKMKNQEGASDLLETDDLGNDESEFEKTPASRPSLPRRTRSGLSVTPLTSRGGVCRQSSARALMSKDNLEEQPSLRASRSGLSVIPLSQREGVRRQSSARALMTKDNLEKQSSLRALVIPNLDGEADLPNVDNLQKDQSENEKALGKRRSSPRTRSGLSRGVQRQSSGKNLMSGDNPKEHQRSVLRGVQKQSSRRSMKSPELKSLVEEQLQRASLGAHRQSSRRALVSKELKNLEGQPRSVSRGIPRQSSDGAIKRAEMKNMEILEKQDTGLSIRKSPPRSRPAASSPSA